MATNPNADDDSTETPTDTTSEDAEAVPAPVQQKIAELDAEAQHLMRFQLFARMRVDWNPRAAEDLHTDLAEFMSNQVDEQEEIGIAEIAIVLWDELTRIERMMREDNAANANEMSQQPAGDVADHLAANSDGTIPTEEENADLSDDPTFH